MNRHDTLVPATSSSGSIRINSGGRKHSRIGSICSAPSTRLLLLTTASLSLASCGTMMGRPEVASFKPAPSALVQPASVRSAYLMNGSICPEPPPDAAMAASAEATAKIATQAGTSVEGSAKVATSMLQLAGRTQTVLVARDLLYSLCILKMNRFYVGNADVGYETAAGVIKTLAEAAKASADADSKNATAEVVKASIAAKATGDPKILALATDLVTTVHTSADAVIAHFTRGNGEVLTASLTAFAATEDVKKLLGPAMATKLGGLKTRDDLRDLLYTTLYDDADELATLAAAFKG